MPRSPTVYSLPPGTTPQVPDTPISSSMFNAAMNDVEQTFNTVQPVAYGGNGVTDNKPLTNSFGLKDSTDTTKRVAFDASGITPATTRTMTVPNYDGVVSVNAKGSDIASASTVDIGRAGGDFVDITGTTTINSFGTAGIGLERTLRFTGALTVTYNATSLILAGGSNAYTYPGMTMVLRSLGSGNWVEIARSGVYIPLMAGALSNQADLAILGFPSGVRLLKIYLSNVSPVLNGQNLQFRASTNGGTSYDSSANAYWYSQDRSSSGGGAPVNPGGLDTRIILTSTIANTASAQFATGEITIYNPGVNQNCSMTFRFAQIDTAGNYTTTSGGGAFRSPVAANAFQISFLSGNLNSGQYTVEYRL